MVDANDATPLPLGHRALAHHYLRKANRLFGGIGKRNLSDPLQGRITEDQWTFIRRKVYKSEFLNSPSDAVRFAVAVWMIIDEVDPDALDQDLRNIVQMGLVEGQIKELDRQDEYVAGLQKALLDPSRRSLVLGGIAGHMEALDNSSPLYLRLKDLYDAHLPRLVP